MLYDSQPTAVCKRMIDSRFFYRDLPVLGGFAQAIATHLHVPLPEDWWIVTADVIGSTHAIEAGKYKDVNTVGAASIAAVLNVDRSLAIPFVFGGDGTTVAVPDCIVEKVKQSLTATQVMAKKNFDLELRVGLIRVAQLVKDGFWVNIAKVTLSDQQTLATFSGRGWEEAERRVKAGNDPCVIYLEGTDPHTEANYEGFECRWNAVHHFNGHKLSLLVAATSSSQEENFATYQLVNKTLSEIYGDVVSYHPLRAEQLHLSINIRNLSHEWKVRTTNSGIWKGVGYFLRMFLQNLAGLYLFANNKDTQAVRWSLYRNELVENSDFRKFDGMLRMVIDGNDAQAIKLETFLSQQYEAGRLVYGMYKSKAALVTCFVQSHNGNHLHFVDGSDGGYALAAKNLKNQLQLKSAVHSK